MGMASGVMVVALTMLLQAPATIDRIVAVVNGDLVTLSDVRACRVLRLVPADATEQAVIEVLVERRLVLAELRRFHAADPPAGDLADRRAAWQTQVGAEAGRLFELAGVTSDFIDRWMADDLRREAYLRQRFGALEATRRAEAIRQWIDALRLRADIIYRGPRGERPPRR